jgi:hypothetical protein
MGEQDKKPPAADGSSKKKWNNRKQRHVNKSNTPSFKFHSVKDELKGNYIDCTGYRQSDSFMKTFQKMADYIDQEYKGGGITRTEVIMQAAVNIPMTTRPVSLSVMAADGSITTTPPDVLDISDYQSAKKIVDS